MGQPWLSQTLTVLCIAFVATASAAKHAAKPSSAPVYGYDELEHEVVWLQEAANKNCRCIGCSDFCAFGDCETQCCVTQYFQATFGCDKEYGPDGPNHYGGPHSEFNPDAPIGPPPVIEVGTCDFTKQFFESPVTVGDSVKYGTFTATCYIVNGGELCGHPFCDQMVMTAQGGMYLIPAVSETDPDTPLVDDSCTFIENPVLGGKAPLPNQSIKKVNKTITPRKPNRPEAPKSKKNRSAKVHAAQYGGEDGPGGSYGGPEDVGPELPPTLYTGDVYLYQGPMTISSRRFDTKYHTGWFEYVYNWEPSGTTIPSTAAGDLYLAKPFTFKLNLFKSHGY